MQLAHKMRSRYGNEKMERNKIKEILFSSHLISLSMFFFFLHTQTTANSAFTDFVVCMCECVYVAVCVHAFFPRSTLHIAPSSSNLGKLWMSERRANV